MTGKVTLRTIGIGHAHNATKHKPLKLLGTPFNSTGKIIDKGTTRYLRGELLGQGSFAQVFKFMALDTGKRYAIKIIPRKLNSAKAQQRVSQTLFMTFVCIVCCSAFLTTSVFLFSIQLHKEIQIHRALKHRHICNFERYFMSNNNYYLLLELCSNGTVNDLIQYRIVLTEPEAAFCMKQLVKAVQYLHDNLVIHRDLKSHNLFLDKNMNIKLGDFGIATQLDSPDEKCKTLCGTPNYVAPEIIRGPKEMRRYSFQVDIWSMGVIFYSMLFGKAPFEAQDFASTYKRIFANEYVLSDSRPITPWAEDLLACMLQSEPSQRYV